MTHEEVEKKRKQISLETLQKISSITLLLTELCVEIENNLVDACNVLTDNKCTWQYHRIIDFGNVVYDFELKEEYRKIIRNGLKYNKEISTFEEEIESLSSVEARLEELQSMSTQIGILLEYEYQKSKEQKK